MIDQSKSPVLSSFSPQHEQRVPHFLFRPSFSEEDFGHVRTLAELHQRQHFGEAEGTGNPAFNTTMRSHPGLVEEGDVDDPVSGGGNPALMEADTPPAGNQEKQP